MMVARSIIGAIRRVFRSRRGRITALSVGAIGGCSALLYMTNASDGHEHPAAIYASSAGGVARFLRSSAVAGRIAVDYWLVHRSGGAISDAHHRNATRVRRLCESNGGAYIKFGQHVSQLEYLVPVEYCEVLRNLCDRCPVTGLSEVEKVMEEEFGNGWREEFGELEEIPVASASLAQVHVGRRKDGTKLAVKVQHRGLREASAGDIRTVQFFLGALRWAFKDFDYEWLGEEIAKNLPQELDFKQEARNCRRTGSNFERWSNVCTPKVLWELTSPRVLTMTFEEGVDMSDAKRIQKMGIDPSATATLLAQTLNAMIFEHGWVHADAHHANLLVRPSPKRKSAPQLVLLDHGLYTELTSTFRDNYASLWYGIFTGDVRRVETAARSLRCGEFYKLFAAILTLRPWDDIERAGAEANLHHLHLCKGGGDLSNYASTYWWEISEVLRRIPRELLLVLKLNDNARSVDKLLGAGVTSLAVTANACAKQVARKVRRDAEGKPWIDRVAAWWESLMIIVHMHLRLLYFQILSTVAAFLEKRRERQEAASLALVAET